MAFPVKKVFGAIFNLAILTKYAYMGNETSFFGSNSRIFDFAQKPMFQVFTGVKVKAD